MNCSWVKWTKHRVRSICDKKIALMYSFNAQRMRLYLELSSLDLLLEDRPMWLLSMLEVPELKGLLTSKRFLHQCKKSCRRMIPEEIRAHAAKSDFNSWYIKIFRILYPISSTRMQSPDALHWCWLPHLGSSSDPRTLKILSTSPRPALQSQHERKCQKWFGERQKFVCTSMYSELYKFPSKYQHVKYIHGITILVFLSWKNVRIKWLVASGTSLYPEAVSDALLSSGEESRLGSTGLSFLDGLPDRFTEAGLRGFKCSSTSVCDGADSTANCSEFWTDLSSVRNDNQDAYSVTLSQANAISSFDFRSFILNAYGLLVLNSITRHRSRT